MAVLFTPFSGGRRPQWKLFLPLKAPFRRSNKVEKSINEKDRVVKNLETVREGCQRHSITV